MIGTVGYLAPEQARGELADHRADIFSLGAVLYEMLTGRRAFKGTSPAELLSSVLRDEPPTAVGVRPAHPARRSTSSSTTASRRAPTSASSRRGTSPSTSTASAARSRSAATRSAAAASGAGGRAPCALGLAALVLLGGGFEVGRRVGAGAAGGAGAAPLVVPAAHRPARRGAPGPARPRRHRLRLRGRRRREPGHLPAARRAAATR